MSLVISSIVARDTILVMCFAVILHYIVARQKWEGKRKKKRINREGAKNAKKENKKEESKREENKREENKREENWG